MLHRLLQLASAATVVALPALAVAADGTPTPGFGRMLFQTVAMLLIVCILAVVTLRLAARYGIGGMGGARDGRRMEVLERTPIGPRHAVVALRVAGRVLIVSQGTAGLRTLTEMPIDEWQTGVGFSAYLAPQTDDDGPDPVPERSAHDPNADELIV